MSEALYPAPFVSSEVETRFGTSVTLLDFARSKRKGD